MTRVRFVSADGSRHIDVEGAPGTRLLELAQANGQPLEGTCEGAMACSTCHVVVAAADFARLPRPSDDEEDMLDFAWGVTRTSRLACQIWLDAGLETLEVRLPGGSVDMSAG